MAPRLDEYGERTENPTPLRLEEARRAGFVARSADLAAAVTVVAGLGLLALFGPGLLAAATRMTAALLGDADPGEAVSGGPFLSAIGPVLASLVPVLSGLLLSAIVVTLIQVGLHASSDAVRVDLTRLSPADGFRRLFCLPSAARTATTLLKLLSVGTVAFVTVRQWLPDILAAAKLHPLDLASAAGEAVLALALRLGVVLVCLALMDWAYQRWQYRRDLRMTRREAIEELRRTEGDARARARRRKEARSLLPSGSLADVRGCNVVLASRSGLAVGIRYDSEESLPRVAVKGAGPTGMLLLGLAEDAGVPIIEDDLLTYSLYRLRRAGQTVPPRLHEMVAQSLAYAREVARKEGPPAPSRRMAVEADA